MSISKKSQPSKKSYNVTFTYETKFAKNVQVLGDFNAWDVNAPKMKSSKGKFTYELELPAGASFQFRYLIDGQAWDNDSKADYYVDSPFAGIQNSVVVLDAMQVDLPSNKASKSTEPKSTKQIKKTNSGTKEATVKVASAKPAKSAKVKNETTKKAAAPKKETKVAATTIKSTEKAPAAKSAPKAAAKKVEKTIVKAAPKTETKAVVKTKPAAEKKAAPKATAKVTTTKPAKATVTKADDLKKIEGIGPKIADLLKADGITSFGALAKATTTSLKSILDKGGSKFTMHDPSSWAQQAELAAAGKWNDLKVLQDKLVGGKKK